MPRKFRRVLRKGYSQKKDSLHNEATSDTEDSVLDTTEVSVQTESIFTNLTTIAVQTDIQTETIFTNLTTIAVQTDIQTETIFTNLTTIAVQTDIMIHPDCCQLDAAIQCSIEEEIKENLPPPDSNIQHVICEGNKDEKFYPLIEKHKGIFKDISG